jgi:hypothetical protein
MTTSKKTCKGYSAVVLTDGSRGNLLKNIPTEIPEKWKVLCHHMTIKFGETIPENELPTNVVFLNVTEIGYGEKVTAVRVSGYPSTNAIPHITISVDTENGGKPSDSNQIKIWKKLLTPILVIGQVKNILT